MSNKFKFFDSQGYYFVTFSTIHWVDVFTRDDYRKIVTSSINYCIQNKALIVFGWVIMTNHVHMLISLQTAAEVTLSDVMRDLKKYTAMHLIKNIKENPQESRKEWLMRMFERAGRSNSNNTVYQFWQQDNHPILLRDAERISSCLAYIHNNPVHAGMVTHPEAYPWSSAGDYAGKKGIVNVTLL